MSASAQLAPVAEERLPEVPLEELLDRARESSRHIERFTYRLVSSTQGAQAVQDAKRMMALAVGLRRMLDGWPNPWRRNGK